MDFESWAELTATIYLANPFCRYSQNYGQNLIIVQQPIYEPAVNVIMLSSGRLLTTKIKSEANGMESGDEDSDGIRDSQRVHDDDVDDERDEVVKEIDVYISPNIMEELYVIQFPLTPTMSTPPTRSAALHHNNAVLPTTARIRPHLSMVELDFDLPSKSIGSEYRPQIPNGLNISRRTFVSNTISNKTHMALGVMSDDGRAIHLTPIVNDIVQMRPIFKHVDALYKDVDGAEDEDYRGEGTVGIGDDEGDGNSRIVSDVLDVTSSSSIDQPLLLQKKETDRAASIRKLSYAFKRATEEMEPWQNLTVYRPESNASKAIRRKAMCNQTLVRHCCVMNDGQYIQTLNYLPHEIQTEESTEMYRSLANNSSTIENLAATLATLLQKGVCTPFMLLENRFPSVTKEDLLRALSGCAVLVRGNFLIKSSLCALPPMAQRVRDAILILMNKYAFVKRERMVGFGVSSHILNDILERFAVCKRNGCGWEMKFEDDCEFCDLYPGFAGLQRAYWIKREDEVRYLINLYEAGEMRPMD